jgi:DNA-binding transcriptional MerR regulator
MQTLWTPAPAHRFSADDLLAVAKALHCQHVKLRTIRTYVERGLLDHPNRDWPGYGGGSSDGWWLLPQFLLWQAEIDQCVKMGKQLGRKLLVFPGLSHIPVSGWLYFGAASGVPLAQVRRALTTWTKANQTPHSLEAANRAAAKLVQQAAHRQAGDRRELRKQLAEMMLTGRYPDREELLYSLQQLIDPHGRGEVKGPAEAPLAPENLCDMILGRIQMARRLLDTPESVSDGLWEWARFVLLRTRRWYLDAQPRLANDPSVRRFPELRTMYKADDFESLVNAACHDLLSVLAVAPLAEGATHLPLELRPEPWLQGKLRLAVGCRTEPSPILLPDGTQPMFVSTTVQLMWNS